MPAPGKSTAANLASITTQLHQLPYACHWCYNDEDLLRSIAAGRVVARGNRGRLLHRMIRLADAIGLGLLIATVAACYELCGVLLAQQNKPSESSALPARIFVGFGAGSESALFNKYKALHGTVGFIDQTNLMSFATLMTLTWREVLRSLTSAIANARQAMAMLPDNLHPYRTDFMTFIGMRMGSYVWYHAWFLKWYQQGGSKSKEVALIAADTCAFAVANLALPSVFMQHGLLSCCLIPAFSTFEALTGDEIAFYRKALPATRMNLVPMPHLPVSELNQQQLLITSVYGTEAEMQLIIPLLEWAKQNTLHISVRPHPRENPRFWTTLDAPGIALEDYKNEFTHALLQKKPRLVVSWASTTLAQALRIGVIPVCVCEDDDDLVAATVYPLYQRCLRWPADAALMTRLLSDDSLYHAELARLAQPLQTNLYD